MDLENAKTRIIELQQIIEENSTKYYIEDNPQLSDFQYDMLVRELRDIEEEYPALISADSQIGRAHV